MLWLYMPRVTLLFLAPRIQRTWMMYKRYLLERDASFFESICSSSAVWTIVGCK